MSSIFGFIFPSLPELLILFMLLTGSLKLSRMIYIMNCFCKRDCGGRINFLSLPDILVSTHVDFLEELLRVVGSQVLTHLNCDMFGQHREEESLLQS